MLFFFLIIIIVALVVVVVVVIAIIETEISLLLIYCWLIAGFFFAFKLGLKPTKQVVCMGPSQHINKQPASQPVCKRAKNSNSNNNYNNYINNIRKAFFCKKKIKKITTTTWDFREKLRATKKKERERERSIEIKAYTHALYTITVKRSTKNVH